MSAGVHLVVDAMGGDCGPRLSVPASLAFLQQYPDSRITLVGDTAPIQTELAGQGFVRLGVLHAPGRVEDSDKVGQAMRRGQASSLWRSMEMLAEGAADACVSGGNTAALMAIGRHLLGTFEGLERPAICKPIPAETGNTYMLDLGANLNCSETQLVQFALMGQALAIADGVANPRVALLNVGAEASKGSPAIQAAAKILGTRGDLNYQGFIEGHQLFSSVADVIVCDGFAGNVALKVSEGAARRLMADLDGKLRGSFGGRLARFLGRRQFSSWVEGYSPSRYNGALLLGLTRPVVKSHGGADRQGFVAALARARELVLNGTVASLQTSLSDKIMTSVQHVESQFQRKK